MFKVKFIDGDEFEGRSFPESDWNKIPEKNIEKLQYHLGNKIIVFENFLKYNHIRPKVGLQGNQIYPVFLMARDPNRSIIIEIDFKKQAFIRHYSKAGKESYVLPEEFKSFRGTVLGGWKEGVKGERPRAFINGNCKD